MIIKFLKNSTKVKNLTLDKTFSKYKIVKMRLVIKNKCENLILNFWNIFYLLKFFYNQINLDFFNNTKIYYNNINKSLYNKFSQKFFIFTQY